MQRALAPDFCPAAIYTFFKISDTSTASREDPEMVQINEVLSHKGHTVHTIAPSATVYRAIEKMVAENVGSLVVVSKGQIRGIITERDYLRRVILQGRASKTTRVEEIMTKQVAFVSPENTVEQTLAIMTEKRCRHLPVIEDGKLVGIVSVGDLIKHLIRDQEVHIKYLTDYITGKYPV
jgi:CBS domain-containing protein